MKRATRNDLILGGAVIAVAAAIAFVLTPHAIVRPQGTESRALAPDFWPLVILGVAALAGAVIAGGALVRRRDGDGAAPTEPTPAAGPGAPLRIAAVFAGLVGFYVMVPLAGMAGAAILLALFLMCLGERQNWAVALPTAVLLPLALYLFFVKVAKVPIPLGLFETLF
jgi:putative tricarboxylic transport membrane protein